jgi:hypothetical protein
MNALKVSGTMGYSIQNPKSKIRALVGLSDRYKYPSKNIAAMLIAE